MTRMTLVVLLLALSPFAASAQVPDVGPSRCVPTPPCYCNEECFRCGPGGCGTQGGGNTGEYIPPHTHRKPNGNLAPNDGYAWATDDPNNRSVVLIVVGAAHPFLPHVIWDSEDGGIKPAFGYDWENGDNPESAGFRVRLSDDLYIGSDGKKRPRSGMRWCNNLPNDDSVCGVAGAAHPRYPNVIWTGESQDFRPASGYHWENGNNPGSAGFRVLPNNVVRAPNGRLTPAPGYDWANNLPDDFSVKLKKGLRLTEDGKFRHSLGYRWVRPNDQADLSVEPLPGVEIREDGNVRPLDGFRWRYPDNPNSAAVVPNPSATTPSQLENIRRFVDTCRRLLADPSTSDEQVKLHCGNVQFDGADPNLPPLIQVRPPSVIRENR